MRKPALLLSLVLIAALLSACGGDDDAKPARATTKPIAPEAFDDALEPAAVLEAAAPFLKTSVRVINA